MSQQPENRWAMDLHAAVVSSATLQVSRAEAWPDNNAQAQIFIASDPKVEAARAALQHCEWDAELDRKLHTLRATFRCRTRRLTRLLHYSVVALAS